MLIIKYHSVTSPVINYTPSYDTEYAILKQSIMKCLSSQYILDNDLNTVFTFCLSNFLNSLTNRRLLSTPNYKSTSHTSLFTTYYTEYICVFLLYTKMTMSYSLSVSVLFSSPLITVTFVAAAFFGDLDFSPGYFLTNGADISVSLFSAIALFIILSAMSLS
jgi:hypothetical protein